MLNSMTGYGRGKYETNGRNYIVEIKSLNHKYNDISIKIPRNLSFLEKKVRDEILNNVRRGKIDVFITFINNSEIGKEIKINRELAKTYLDEIQSLANDNGLDTNINTIELIKLPEVLTIENGADEQLLWDELYMALELALKDLNQMRRTEGSKIAEDIKYRHNIIIKKLQEISNYSTGLVEEYIVKLKERIKELTKTDVIDETRLAQEIVIYSDKCSIQEELIRLNSHMNQLLNFIESTEPIGKKMDFLIQEINREINTIGSKANKLEITNLTVELKTIVEDIREQIQNIE